MTKPKTSHGTFIHGIAASEHLDSSGEKIKVDGIDISSLTKDGVFNWEHESKQSSQVVGKILEAKKIFTKKDCTNSNHLYWWGKIESPFLYVAGELLDAEGHSGAEDVAKERLQVLSQMKSILNTIAIDGEDDYVNISKNFASLPQVQMNMYQIVAAAADIPFTRFMGKSADGMNATGEGDLINYYDAIKGEIQIGQLQEIYSFLDPIIYNHLYGSREIIEYEFN